MAAECGVAAVVIVGVQPSRELVAAFAVAGVEVGVGPLVGQGAVEAFDLTVGLGSVGAGSAMLDLTECVSERVRSVAGTVVGQHVFDRDAVLGEPCVARSQNAAAVALRSSPNSSE